MVFQFHRDAGQQFEQQRRVTTNAIIPFIEEAFPIKEDLHMLEIGRVRVWGLNQEGLVFSPYTHGGGELEAGGYLGDSHISASLSNPYLVGGGSAGPLFKGISAAPRAEMFKYIGGLDMNVLAGASYLREDLLILKGLFGGFTRKKLILLGEVDFATDWAAPGSTALASYFEFDFQVTQGVRTFLKYDFYDDDTAWQANSLSRLTLGGEWFPMPFVEVKPQIRLNRNTIGAPPRPPTFCCSSTSSSSPL